jgi:transposase-like protein
MRDLFGCPVSPATVARAARVASGKLVGVEQRLKAALRDSQVIGVDETGLRVAGSGGYVHVARTEALTHYAYDERRGKAAMDETGILPQFTGTLVRDGFSSYQWYRVAIASVMLICCVISSSSQRSARSRRSGLSRSPSSSSRAKTRRRRANAP